MEGVSKKKIAVIGSGKIGRCWALLFSAAGHPVTMQDVNEEQFGSARASIGQIADDLKRDELFRGSLSTKQVLDQISFTTDLKECIQDAFYIQECVFEDYDLKKKIFLLLDPLLSDSQIVASSTSALPPSEFSQGLKHKENCLVAHPVNPPIYCPLVELVPAPWTSEAAVLTAKKLMVDIGQEPVVLKKEIVGFGVNRLQYALVAECWRLVMEGVMTAEDVDKVVSEGLGLRWAFVGPLEVTALNGDGIVDHNTRYNRGFKKVCDSFGPTPDLESPQLMEQARLQVESRVPLEKLGERRAWRDRCLANLARLKRRMKVGQEN